MSETTYHVRMSDFGRYVGEWHPICMCGGRDFVIDRYVEDVMDAFIFTREGATKMAERLGVIAVMLTKTRQVRRVR